jgi:hypothetical protein
MIHTQTLDFVKRNENSSEEQFMLFFQRQCEAVDNRSKDLQKFCNAIESFSLVNELKENIVDRSSYERTQVEKLAINSMQCGLQEVTLARIFGIEQFK